ncbi:hypothetical protein R2083_07160 [Nitrosomonas sp. Is35]|uniref:hypothetical protein n=1 Tax=Nitrosomonas sp. Is35 TaxID=3080534 RepID=UPI00294B05C6|nr:hypothetical protein [Nitrosomonas sp. Is35]MDV6347294.1 hypothetical protein [Nitrosomonas sp. Is35]
MIDWDELIRAENDTETSENTPNSRARPTDSDGHHGKVGQLETNNQDVLDDSALLALPALLKNKGVGFEQENHAPGEGVASDNYCATKTHPINPIAVTLLLTCCNKATFTKEETIEAIINLQTIPQSEQVRSWAILCQKYGINPHKVIHPFIRSSNKGTSCQGCKHIEMQKIATDKRPVFRFTCKQQHPMLEAFYVGERVLIAPESCGDYLPTA